MYNVASQTMNAEVTSLGHWFNYNNFSFLLLEEDCPYPLWGMLSIGIEKALWTLPGFIREFCLSFPQTFLIEEELEMHKGT